MNIEKLRKELKAKAKIVVTTKSRNAAGFGVTGPDGQAYSAPTKAEALTNLRVRIQCYEPKPWKVVAL